MNLSAALVLYSYQIHNFIILFLWGKVLVIADAIHSRIYM